MSTQGRAIPFDRVFDEGFKTSFPTNHMTSQLAVDKSYYSPPAAAATTTTFMRIQSTINEKVDANLTCGGPCRCCYCCFDACILFGT